MNFIWLSFGKVSVECAVSSETCVVSKYEYQRYRGGYAKQRFLAENCKCNLYNGPALRDGEQYRNPYTCDRFECNCTWVKFLKLDMRVRQTLEFTMFRSRPRLMGETEWEFEFEGCELASYSRIHMKGPDHCKEVLRNCEPMMVERRDGSPCKLGPGERFGSYAVGK